MTLRQSILAICVLITSSLWAQSRKDTIYSQIPGGITMYDSEVDTMTIRTFGKDGKIKWEDSYLQGKLISVKYWYYNKDVYGYLIKDKGKLKPRKTYRKEFYSDGKLRIEATEINNKKDGAYKTYFQNGFPQCNCNYKYGKADSIQIKHFENGQISLICNYKNGKEDGKTIYYFDNGQIWSERIYNDGKPWEVLTNFDINGNVMEKGTLKDGNGTLFIYDENGKLTDIEYYEKGKLKRTEKQNNI